MGHLLSSQCHQWWAVGKGMGITNRVVKTACKLSNSIRCSEINRLQITTGSGKAQGREIPFLKSLPLGRQDVCFWSCPSPSRQHGYLVACNGLSSQLVASFRLFLLPGSRDSGLSPFNTSHKGLCGPRELLGMFLKKPMGLLWPDLLGWCSLYCSW